jgi:hypothetical protein
MGANHMDATWMLWDAVGSQGRAKHVTPRLAFQTRLNGSGPPPGAVRLTLERDNVIVCKFEVLDGELG